MDAVPQKNRVTHEALMGYQTILVEKKGAFARLTLNRPEARNALSLEMREEIAAALDDLGGDSSVRLLAITGAGGNFCAGGDVKLMAAKRFSVEEARARMELMTGMVLKLANFPAPTLALVEGFAVGAGCNLALACDLIIASDRAKFGQVFSKVGLIPDGGGSYFLPRLVGLAKAKELVFTADLIDAEEALRIGLVNRVVPGDRLLAEAEELIGKIVAGPPKILARAKRLLNRSLGNDLTEALREEAEGQAFAMTSEDHQEGLRAFFEKRPPKFTGR